jgi:hypothetical protein
MKSKSLTQKISLLTLSLLSAGSLFGKTLTVDLKTEELDNSFKRPNTFIIRSIQAGSTTDVDNIKITDLDTNKVVYENSFSNPGDATRDLVLHYYPDSGGVYSRPQNTNRKDYVENGTMTRIVNGKLRLETTGFGRNGRGGYNSVSDATFTNQLPHNFLVEFDAKRMQWAGHLHIYATYKNPGDTSANYVPSENSFKGDQVKLAMYGEGSWFNPPTISITGKKSPFSFAKPSGNPTKNHRYGMSINGTTVNFYMDGKSIGTANLPDYLKEEKPMNESDLTNGLVAWYPLDGNASDMSGNSRHGTIYGSNPTEDRHGKMNRAYNFDGIDDYIKINHDKAFNHLPLSISAWFNSNGNSGQAGIVSKYWAAHWNGWQIMDFNGDLVPWYLRSLSPRNVIIGKYGESKAFETKTPLNSWSHATVVFSEDGGTLFLNGKEADSMKWTGQASAPTTNQPVTIGRYQGASNGYFKGSIDDVRIYDRALSEEEVLALYELESKNPNEDRPTPPPAPGAGGLTPPDPDYKDTIAELKRLLAEKDKKLAHCEKEMAAKNQEIETLQGKVIGLEKLVASLDTNNKELKEQIQNLREDNQNLNYEITVTNEHLEKAIQVAETPFISGWVYDPERGWLFTDADRFPLIYTHKDQTWHYYELGSSKPRYFFNYKSQEWVAWDAIPVESDQVVASNQNL